MAVAVGRATEAMKSGLCQGELLSLKTATTSVFLANRLQPALADPAVRGDDATRLMQLVARRDRAAGRERSPDVATAQQMLRVVRVAATHVLACKAHKDGYLLKKGADIFAFLNEVPQALMQISQLSIWPETRWSRHAAVVELLESNLLDISFQLESLSERPVDCMALLSLRGILLPTEIVTAVRHDLRFDPGVLPGETLLPVTVDLLMRLEKRGFWKSWVEACLRILDNMLSLRWQAKDPKLLFIAPAFHPVQLSIPYAFLLLCVSPAGSTMPHRMLLAGAADVLTRFLRVLAVRDADMAYTLASGRRLLKCKCAHEIADEVGPELPGKLCQRITMMRICSFAWDIGALMSFFQCAGCKKWSQHAFGSSCQCKSTAATVPDLMACGGCHVAMYCSRECQKLDRPAHKEECQRWKALFSKSLEDVTKGLAELVA